MTRAKQFTLREQPRLCTAGSPAIPPGPPRASRPSSTTLRDPPDDDEATAATPRRWCGERWPLRSVTVTAMSAGGGATSCPSSPDDLDDLDRAGLAVLLRAGLWSGLRSWIRRSTYAAARARRSQRPRPLSTSPSLTPKSAAFSTLTTRNQAVARIAVPGPRDRRAARRAQPIGGWLHALRCPRRTQRRAAFGRRRPAHYVEGRPS